MHKHSGPTTGIAEVRVDRGRPTEFDAASLPRQLAGVAELADATDSKSVDRKIVGVQVPPPAPLYTRFGGSCCYVLLLQSVDGSTSPAWCAARLHAFLPRQTEDR